MTVREPLILYFRADCHLCDQVVEMLDRLKVPWRPIDIDGDSGLTGKYGIHVPVLRHPASGRELYFPFVEFEILQLMESEA